jgi:uncharacterized damage-inducible protein DinB
MSTVLETILPKMAATHAKLLAYAASLDEAAADRPVGPEQWSPRQMIGHLVDSERAHRRFIETVASDAPLPALENFDRDAWNAGRVAKRADQSLAEIVAAFEVERTATLATLQALPDDAWAKAGHHPALGEITVEYAARVIGIHENMHLKELGG